MIKRRDLFTGTGLGLGAMTLGKKEGIGTAQAAPPATLRAPLRETMRHLDQPRSGVMLGGVGAGGGELRKDGRFYNWTAFNNSPRGTGPLLGPNIAQESIQFFKLRYEVPGQEPRIKLLQIENNTEVGTVTVHVYEFPWMSGVEKIEYSARFPYADLVFTDPEMPVAVRLRAWSPFVPHDIDSSSLPAIVFDFTVTNTSNKPVHVMLMACQRNMVGYDVAEKLYQAEMRDGAGYRMFEAGARELPAEHGSAGTMALASLSPQSGAYLGWEHRHPYFERILRARTLPEIDETERRTRRDPKTGKRWALPRVFNTLSVSHELLPRRGFEHTFVAAWHFPNLWNETRTKLVGNYYTRRFQSAADVARHVVRNKDDLKARTFGFLDAFYDSDADQFVLDQINSQLNTFVTSGILSREGQLGILEGLTETQSWGPVATTDVSVYGSVALMTFFPENLRQTLRAHQSQQHKNGAINHGLRRDFTSETQTFGAAEKVRLDLHAQHAGMVLRDYFWTGDRAYLKECWPSVKRALEYCVKERDLNGDSMPDMEGIMSSYDNFPMFGTAAYIGSQWLAALSGAVTAADVLGDAEAKARYGGFLEKGRKLFEDALWNGSYYRLWNDEGGKHGGKDEGCLTDQLIGQWVTRFWGVPELFQAERVRAALQSILRMSYRKNFGLRNCSWPGGEPWMDVPDDIWVDQANTCWSGVELAFASFLIYEGLYKEGLDVIRTVDERYRKAGRYFDHHEFGGHYFRPMAAVGILHALCGLAINQGTLTFAPPVPKKDLRLFFATPSATGHYNRRGSGAGQTVRLDLATGSVTLSGLRLSFDKPSQKAQLRKDGKPVAATVTIEGKRAHFAFAEPLTLSAGQKLEARAG